MTLQEARKYAQNIILKGTSIVILILFIVLLIEETRGDFANGILFFIAAVFNLYSIVGIVILFVLSYIFSSIAIEEVIVKKRNNFIIAIKYSISISLSTTIYGILIGVIKKRLYSSQEIIMILENHFFDMFVRMFFFILLIWIWGTKKMKSKKINFMENTNNN
jgi:hypothetical protein